MEDYIGYIKNLAENKLPTIFYNSGPEHASIVMSNIFQNSKDMIRIFAGNFSGEVSQNERYIESLKSYLNRKGKVHILLDEYTEDKKPHLFDLLSTYSFFNPENIEIKKTNTHVVEEKTKKKIHFTTGDNCMFRLEEDTDKFLAKGSFNNLELTDKLIKYFDQIFNSRDSKSIKLN
ncbi:MAG: hypothetical protein Q8L88_03575 [Bacteroidota bacterium]|nr:hypothetical protein [Bacteroidota bacterium]